MQNPISSLDRLKPIEGNLNDQTLLLASHGGKTSKLPLGKLKTFLGGGSGGSGEGFIFEDLAEHVETVSVPSTMEFFYMGTEPIFTGNNVVGSITLVGGQSVAISSFKVIKETSYRMRLFPNTRLTILATKRKIDVSTAGPNNDPIEAAGGKYLVNLFIGEGNISTNVENQDIYLEFTQAAEDWLKITQTGTELIWEINGEEVIRTPQDPDDVWFNVLQEPNSNETPPSPFQYDLTGTLAGHQISLDFESLVDMVIYETSHELTILGRRVAVGDYVQLHANKTKIMVFPQLSRLYDFDVTDPENLVIAPLEFTSHNPFVPTTIDLEGKTATFTLPSQSLHYVDFADVTPETLENFYVYQEENYPNRLRIKSLENFDPETAPNPITAEYKIDKNSIYGFSTAYNSLGNASAANFYFYAGVDRDKNYIRFKWTKYPWNTYEWFVCGENGEEISVASVSSSADVRISLKDGISLRILDSTTLQEAINETVESFTHYLTFTDADPQITVRAVYEVSQEAIDSNNWTYGYPLADISHALSASQSYNNLLPVELGMGNGVLEFKFEKQKNFGLYIVAANALAELCENISGSGENDFPVVVLNVKYNVDDDSYTYNLIANNQSRTDTIQLSPQEELKARLTKVGGSLNLQFMTQSVSSTKEDKSRLFISSTSGVWTTGVFEEHLIQLDLAGVQGASTLDLSSIQPRDRIRVIGGKAVIHGKTINPGDIVEFFNNKKESLVTAKQGDGSTQQETLIARDRYGDVLPDVRAWYDPLLKRIAVAGRLYYSGYGNTDVVTIRVPTALVNKIFNWVPVGFFGISNFASYGYPFLSTNVNGNTITLTVGSSGGMWTSGNIVIPDSTVVTIEE